MSINKALDSILENNLIDMKNHFNAALTEKAVNKLEEAKINIAKNYFGKK